MLERIQESSIVRSFVNCAELGKLYGHYSRNPLGMLESDEVIFSCWGETYFHEIDESSCSSLALLSILRHESFSIACTLDVLFDQCESPIERMFLSALICACNNKEIGIAVYSDERYPQFENLPPYTSSCLHIYPQEQIGDYRVDFLLTLILDDHMTFLEDHSGCLVSGKSQLVIECDGHDFHEKTREQASRDKERDRALQNCGYTVFRFTGSDIYNDAFSCVIESIEHLFVRIIREATGKPEAEWLGCDSSGVDRTKGLTGADLDGAS